MAIFFCAIPVGSALGYIVGGLMNTHFGWRPAFFVAGIPGVALAFLCLGLSDPPRGSQDGGAAPAAKPSHSNLLTDLRATYRDLLRNRPYVITVLGYAAYTFAMGGLASWMPAFLQRIRGLPADKATVQFGAIVVVTGFLGTFVGGWLGDFCAKYSQQGYVLVSAIATLVAAPFVWFALTVASPTWYLVCMVIAQLLMFLSTGPINAAIVNLVHANQRATAVALSVFAIHLLGDAASPYLIGVVSDASSLQQALKIIPGVVLLSGALWMWAARAPSRTPPR